MSYVSEPVEGRPGALCFIDRETDHILNVISTGGSSGGPVDYRLSGPGIDHYFSAERVFPKLSAAERDTLNIADGETAEVWRIYVTDASENIMNEIKRVMLAYKTVAGFHYPGSTYFVQFGLTGGLQNA
jgi:hypothetical protein